MGKWFKIICLVLFIMMVGYIIPVFILDPHPWESNLEKETRKILSSKENFLVLKIVEYTAEDGEGAHLYTWFGIRYGTVKGVYGQCDLALCYRGLKLSRFWTKKDFQNF